MIQNRDKISNKEYKGLTSLKETKQESVDKVLDLYSQGRSQNFIEKELHITRRTIRGILIKYDRIRSRTEQQTDHAHTFSTLREDAFDIVTDEMAYWLGFLYADGYVTNPEGLKKYLGILLKASDKPHIEKFLEWLKAPQKIFSTITTLNGQQYESVGVHIGSRKLYTRLWEWGFTHNKSRDAKPPVAMKYNRDFWRGVVDGDGYLGMINDSSRLRTRPRLHLCGTEDTIKGFKDFVTFSGIETEASVRKAKDRNLFMIEVGDAIAKKVVTLLYKDSTVYLQRKFDNYLELIKE